MQTPDCVVPLERLLRCRPRRDLCAVGSEADKHVGSAFPGEPLAQAVGPDLLGHRPVHLGFPPARRRTQVVQALLCGIGADEVFQKGVVAGHAAVLHGRRVGRDTLVGIGARLLSGCEVGEECLIAAGTLITEGRRIPPRSVVMGVPGKVIRPITPEEVERTRTICAHYLELAQRYVRSGYSPPWCR